MRWGMAEVDGARGLVVQEGEGIRVLAPLCERFFGSSSCSLDEMIREPLSRRSEFERLVKKNLEAMPVFRVGPRARLLAPLQSPGKILCIGLNYVGHAHEAEREVPDEPVFFSKYRTSIIGPGEPIRRPSFVQKLDYEAELAVVIGARGRYIPEHRVSEFVFGYTIMNDVSARDWQFKSGQWVHGKAIDTFAPLGPWVVSRAALPNVEECVLELKLNGKVMQSARVADMVFPIPTLISYLSRFVTLEPGDIISTGTPPGVGHRRNPPVYLQAGDRLEISITHLGVLENPVIDDLLEPTGT